MKLRYTRAGFTLIELLVVVAIIALLIAILLPSLSQAKKLAKASVCASNIRGICQGMNVYAASWDGKIPGNGWTSAAFIYTAATGAKPEDGNNVSANDVPHIVSTFDWMSPVAEVEGVPFELGKNNNQRLTRFQQLDLMKMFTCPSNDLQALAYSGSQPSFAGTLPETSYASAILFHYSGGNTTPVFQLSTTDVTLPSYRPNIYKVGNTSAKIFIADGGKFSNSSTVPDINLTYNASDFATQFGDAGAFSNASKCWDRGLAPGNINNGGGTFDARFYAYRHGGGTQGGASGAFKMNAGFYDGHVDKITDLDSANPNLWAPTGTVIPSSLVQKDTSNIYFGGQSSILVP